MTTPAPRPTNVRARRLAELFPLLADLTLAGPPAADVLVTGVTHASRAVRPGDLYAGLPGSRVHGAAFSRQAATAGAVAVLTDAAGVAEAAPSGLPVLVVASPRERLGAVASWAYGDPTAALRLLGVTGTNGKTTVAYLVEAGLRAEGVPTGLVGTVETRVAGRAVPSVRTTPEATDLQALFAAMVERGVRAAAMEVSSHALALHRVEATRFAGAAFTNLSQDHLDFHGTMEDYFAAKASLFTPGRAGVALVGVDDRWGRRLAASLPHAVTYGVGAPDADWRATQVAAGPAGTSFRVRGPAGQDVPAAVRLPGAFNVANALAAIALLASTGTPLAAAVEGVAGLPGVPGRMERVDAGQPFLALVDYAHTPEAVDRLLAAVRALVRGRVVVVLGCGGDR
ncbi:MAG TPA: UDP-N-acetylmuramoyl-L-alanyl-D-glutamate--2,6-diaminopimelate ligase, partial [Frankiaceae bacterium]|nr:UDP-N-acetylmuramoyl-L-alanyl-D-glutamate--2,6-diaminopimelate ligase [Frankiaceae bacterium]